MRPVTSVTIMGAANGWTLICQVVILITLARTAPIETVGSYGLVLALLQPLYMLSLAGLRSNLAADAKHEIDLNTALALRLSLAALFGVVCLNGIWFWRPALLPIALPLIFLKAVEMIGDLAFGAAQRDGRIGAVARGWMLRGAVSLGAFALGLALSGSTTTALWAQASGVGCCVIFHDLRQAANSQFPRPCWRLDDLLGLFRATLPLGLSQWLVAAQMALPRLTLDALLGAAAVAVFMPVAYLERAAVTGTNAADLALGWRLARLWSADNRLEFYKILGWMMVLTGGAGGAILIGIAWYGESIVRFSFGSEYAETSAVLIWVTPAIILRICANVLQSGLIAQRRFGALGWVKAGLFAISIPVIWWSVSVNGLTGIGQALSGLALLRLLSLGSLMVLRSGYQKETMPLPKAAQSRG